MKTINLEEILKPKLKTLNCLPELVTFESTEEKIYFDECIIKHTKDHITG